MLKKLLSALTGAVLFLSMPIVSLAVERYEVLQVGDEDAWVMELQEKLNEMGYLKVPATGYYGTNTQNAVLRYQKDHGLSADGKAGPVTRESILGDAYKEITGPRENGVDQSIITRPNGSSTASGDIGSLPQVKPNPDKPAEVKPEATQKPANDNEVDALRLGDSGDAVTALQEKLREYEYYEYGSITGYFGPVTEEAVRKFQRTYGLEEDGIVGASAQAILNSSGLRYYMMQPGDNGDDVRKMQARLSELGYLDSSATGYFGSVTKRALMAFQDRNGLTADGTAGKDTRALLYSDDALEAVSGGGDEPAPEPAQKPDNSDPSAEPNGSDEPSEGPGNNSDEPSEDPGSSDEPSADPDDNNGDEPSEDPGDNSDEPSEDPSDNNGGEPSEDPSDSSDEPSEDPGDNNGDEPSEDPGDNNGDEPSEDPGDNGDEPSEDPGDNGDEPSEDPGDNSDEPSEDPGDNGDEPSEDPGDSEDPDDNGDGSTAEGVDRLLEVAESQTGKPYVYGSSGPNSFDCSGFVYYALKGAGVSCSRQSAAGFAGTSSWETIRSKDSLRVGDLVFFKSDSSSSISHVGIYLGDGSFIHSAPSIDGVGYSTMSSGYYSRNFVTAKRVF